MFWEKYHSWETAEAAWDQGAKKAELNQAMRKLKTFPNIPGITTETQKGLKWKSFKYMVTHDRQRVILRHFLKHPIRYGFRLLYSLFRKTSYRKDEDFFLYGISSVQDFEKRLKNSILAVGFSYCQKPLECPSGRFTDRCMHQADHPICRQCPIGKIVHALPKNKVKPLIIPTIHYIGEKVFDLIHNYPDQQVLFLITACELTLKMFADYGNMAGLKGIGIRLDGRICNTMRAFELSEKGIKPGLTLFTPKTEKRVLELIRKIREYAFS
ncbi:MAG: hypothetical protein R3E91_04090 [Chlamydiales bacterium]